jgi:hypothetical protein
MGCGGGGCSCARGVTRSAPGAGGAKLVEFLADGSPSVCY